MPVPKPVFGRIRHKTAKLDGPIPDEVMTEAIWAVVGTRGLVDIFLYKDVRRLLIKYKRTAVQEKLRDYTKRGLIDEFTDGSYEVQWLAGRDQVT